MAMYALIIKVLNRVVFEKNRLVQMVGDILNKGLLARHRAPRHALPGELVVSLTSYAPRFPTLYPTLARLLLQDVRPDHIILWVSEEDLAGVPPEINALTAHGLEIRVADNLGPYTKIIPALHAFPEAFIVTADDDIPYDRAWLRDLISSWNGTHNQIVTHRAHRIVMDRPGRPQPYQNWAQCIKGPLLDTMIFPTGVGGVLYPPGSLHPDVLDRETFMTLCPRADDVWLYWMGRRAGAVYTKTAGRRDVVCVVRSQDVALMYQNVQGGGNDICIANLIARYGWPA